MPAIWMRTVAHGTCGRATAKCRGMSHWKAEIDPIFNNLRVSRNGNCKDEQFLLLLGKLR